MTDDERSQIDEAAEADLALLTGAYALDAVDDIERARVERYLATSSEATREVASLRETAAALAAANPVVPPAQLRERVLAGIARTPQAPPVVTPSSRKRNAAKSYRLLAVAATVLAVVAGGLGVVAISQQRQLTAATRAAAFASSARDVLAAPDAQIVGIEINDFNGSVVLSKSLDRGLLVADSLSPPPSGKTYQAWTVTAGGVAQSAGTFVPNADGTVALAIGGGIGAASTVAITVEPDGGSPQPTSTPIGAATLA